MYNFFLLHEEIVALISGLQNWDLNNGVFTCSIFIQIALKFTWRLAHWGRVTHICLSDLTIIGSDNGLSPGRRQAIIRTRAGILLIRPLGTNFNEILIEILIFSFKKMRLKVSSVKRRPFCLGLNVLTGTKCTWVQEMANHKSTQLTNHYLN